MLDIVTQTYLIITSVVLVFFAPGFSLTLLLFPDPELDRLERFTLAAITSVALSSLAGATLLMIPAALSLRVFTLLLVALSLLLACGAWWRSRSRDDEVTSARFSSKRGAWFAYLALGAVLMPILLGGQTSGSLRSPLRFTEFFLEPGQSGQVFEVERGEQGKLLIPVSVRAGLDHTGPFLIEVYSEEEKVWESPVFSVQVNESWHETLNVPPPSHLRSNSLHLYLISDVDKEPLRHLTVWLSYKDS
ncbi:MAG TPA: DUF1616 domain-containing protein [Chloroflexota bacterium]|nr:DUF1616 domain-containing protein [Chloroflexota bacterium]HUM67381.1 DUF1616 domain-containing protein [Chloroflexota bacterium]